MAKSEQPAQEAPKAKKPLKRKYLIPDIEHGGPSVTVEATSIEEAIALSQQKGKTTQS